jgi:hypothetical protein
MGCFQSSEAGLHDQSMMARGGVRAGSVGGADDAAAAMLGNNALSSKVELFVSCANLRNLDSGIGNKSDPYVILEEWQTAGGQTGQTTGQTGQATGAAFGGGGRWLEVGRSEIVTNSLSPVFVKRFKMVYRFEQVQKLRVRVFDADERSADDFAGETAALVLADVMTGQHAQKTVPLVGQTPAGPATGTCTVRGEEMKRQSGTVTLRCRGVKLANMDGLFGKSDPFVRISRVPAGETRRQATHLHQQRFKNLPVYKTEVVRNNLNPTWRPIRVSLNSLCNGDAERPILFEVIDYDRDGTHDLIGSATATLAELMREAGAVALPLVNGRTGKKGVGTLVVDSCTVEYEPSFLDYITHGTEVNFLVAVDFTGSNGHQSSPSSLHHISPYAGQLNQYQQCIHRVGDVLEFYDHDKEFPTWGFGGVTRPGGAAEHCFNLVPGPPNATAVGIAGILQAYNAAVQTVQLSGPTIFSQVLQTATAMATAGCDGSQYFVLLIITDGVITDMDATRDAIVAACDVPLSVLIVGVGNANFDRMEELDGDDVRLRNSRGQAAKRDIVQFVAYRDFARRSPQAFSSELLAEIPGQLVGFMKSRGIRPMAAAPAPAAAPPAAPAPVMGPPSSSASSFASVSSVGVGVEMAAPGAVMFVRDKPKLQTQESIPRML